MTGPAIGVEEEFHIVDAGTRHLVPRSGLLLEALPKDRFTKELQRAAVESHTLPVHDLREVARDLTGLRAVMIAVAEDLGLGVVAAGSAPLTDLKQMRVTPDPRYEQIVDDYQLLAREQLICATQVHVEVGDPDLAIAISHRLAPWLAPLLALSCSSPYWLGEDTGYASYRTLVWRRWPTAGPMAKFESAAEYEGMLEELIRSGVISDVGMAYFDIRPSAHVPTVELRICDSCTRVDDIVLIAGLFRALVVRECPAIRRDPDSEVQLERVRAATWQAARSGMEGELVDPVEGVRGPAASVIERMVAGLRPQLEEAGDWELVSALARDALGRGSSAERQRRAFARRGSLADVVDLLVAETAIGGWDEPVDGDTRPPCRPAA